MLITYLVTGCATINSPDLKLHKSEISKLPFCQSLENKFDDVDRDPEFSSYSDLSKVYEVKIDKFDIEKYSLEEEANSQGLAYGKYITDKKIWDKALSPVSASYDLIFDYAGLLYNNLVLPKKLLITRGGQYKQDDMLIDSDISYKAEGNFLLVSNPPSWKDFFTSPPNKPYVVKVSSLENAKKFKEEWKSSFTEGYDEGVCISYLNLLQSLKKLPDDYSARFAFIVAEYYTVTKPPEIESIIRDIQISKTEIKLGEKIYKVNDLGNFNNQKNWGEVSNGE